MNANRSMTPEDAVLLIVTVINNYDIAISLAGSTYV